MKKTEFTQSISHIKIRHIWTALSLIAIMAALSFYFADGYYNLGEEKYRIYIRVAGLCECVWLIITIAGAAAGRRIREIPAVISGLSALEWFLVLLNVSAIISTLTSDFRSTSVWGQDGWHMGLAVQLLMTAGCVMCMDFFAGADKKLIYAVAGAFGLISAIVFVLGVINRYSIYPFYMYGQAEDFISTLGNINWFCGYWCIWTGIGCGVYLLSAKTWLKAVSGIYVWICAVTGMCCGASSCYLVWAIVSFAALVWALDDPGHLIRLCHMEMIMLAALPTIRFIGSMRPDRMWYESVLLRNVSYSDVWILPYVLGTVVFAVLVEIYRRHKADRSFLRHILIGGSIGLVVAAVIIIILNSSIEGGIWPVRGKSLFTWGIHWGTGRGGIWTVSVQLIRRLFPFRIFFGVGCDCMCAFAYSMPDMTATLHRFLGDLYLTNAHNELLSMIINQGITGAAAYFGVQIAHMSMCVRAVKNGDADGFVLGALFAAAGYMVIGLVGFMQILSTPFLFMSIGMAFGLIKRKNVNIING